MMIDAIPQELQQRLDKFNQQHLVTHWKDLSSEQCSRLMAELESIDFAEIQQALATKAASTSAETPASRAARCQPPSQLIRLADLEQDAEKRQQTEKAGLKMLRDGKVGVILVAGGQGTRLGFDHPKGMFPIGPVSDHTVFQILFEQVIARSQQAGAAIPYFIMTSDATHDETVAFFEEHDYFGMNADDVTLFKQGTMPAIDAETGKVLMSAPNAIAKSPDGHGGMLQALHKSGAFARMVDAGLEALFYHQVDNPSVIVCDPILLGCHQIYESEITTKVVAKMSAEERMGVLVEVDEQMEIIEYSDLPSDVASATDDSGNLRIWAGNTAIHVFSVAFLKRLHDAGIDLPFHLANKKVPYIDADGQLVEPAKPNGIKFERFIFDVLPQATKALVFEADRDREFNPVKNAEGNDSPETAKAALIRTARNWLESAGAIVAGKVPVEISPLFALDIADVKEKIEPGRMFAEPTYLR